MKAARGTRNLSLALLAGLTVLPLLNGGFLRGVWTGTALVVAAAALALWMSEKTRATAVSRLSIQIAFALGATVLLGCLQSVPVPRPVLAALAPGASELDMALGRPDGLFPITQDPAATRTVMVSLLIGIVILLVAAQRLVDRPAMRVIAAALVGSAAVVALAGVVDYCHGASLWHPDQPANARPFGPFVNRNHAATLMILALPMALALGRDLVTSGRRAWGNSLLLAAVVLILGLLFNGSRGGALALVAAIALGAALMPLRLRYRGAVLVATVALVAVPGVASTRVGETTTVSERLALARDSLTMADDAPWGGIGLGAFDQAYRPYHSIERFLRFEHVESEPLELLVEGGVPLFVLALVMGGVIFSAAARVLRQRRREWLPAGVALGVTAFCVHACFDFPLRIPGLAVGLLLCLAMLGRLAEEGA